MLRVGNKEEDVEVEMTHCQRFLEAREPLLTMPNLHRGGERSERNVEVRGDMEHGAEPDKHLDNK